MWQMLHRMRIPSSRCGRIWTPVQHNHRHHHIRLFEVVKRNRQHTVLKIDVGIYMDIHTIHAS